MADISAVPPVPLPPLMPLPPTAPVTKLDWETLIVAPLPAASARAVPPAALPPSPRSPTVPNPPSPRSKERRVGEEWVSTCRSRWSQDHQKKKNKQEH